VRQGLLEAPEPPPQQVFPPVCTRPGAPVSALVETEPCLPPHSRGVLVGCCSIHGRCWPLGLSLAVRRPAVDWNFANWDLVDWLSKMGEGPPPAGFTTDAPAAPAREKTTEQANEKAKRSGMFDDQFSQHMLFNVYRYEYYPTLTTHGCVKMTYKDRLSTAGTVNEAEWLPIERITRAPVVPGGPRVEANVTDQVGVILVPRPPDLRYEPLREPWAEEKKDEAGVKCIERILK
jgi:hypothetical protein